MLSDLRLIPDLKPGAAPWAESTLDRFCGASIRSCGGLRYAFCESKFFEGARNLMVQEDADVVIAKSDEGYEPFHALYRRETCLRRSKPRLMRINGKSFPGFHR